MKSPLAQFIGFMFCFTMRRLGLAPINDRKGIFFCLLFNKVIRDIYYKRTFEMQAKMGANWPPGSTKRNWGIVFILSARGCRHLSVKVHHTVVS